MEKKKFIVNTALLTGSSLMMSCIGMAYQVWLVGRIGAAGIGLYQLVIAVMGLGATVAVSGIRFAVTRLVSEEIGLGRGAGVGGAMARCAGYSAFFGLSAGAIMWLIAQPVGFLWVGDARTVLSLKIMAFSLPLISMCSVISGYFTACGRVWKPALIHLAEQLFGIGLSAFLLYRSPAGDIEKNCAAVVTGGLGADALSFLLLSAAYFVDRRRHCVSGGVGTRQTARMLGIAMPLAVSAYARSALGTIEHLLVPRGLKAAGYTADSALAGYGVIQGMVLPIVLFPSCLLCALAEMIVPELTRAQVSGGKSIPATVSSTLTKSFGYSLAVAAFMFIFSDKLGLSIYHSAEAGHYIRLLSPLIPIMYTDTAIDGCLKGLGQQVWSMGINILDALVSVVLVWFLLPEYALGAYIAIIYFSEFLNFALSLARLCRVMKKGPPD